jgi:DNA-binding NarL/FixJ family response regulator
MIRVFLCDDHEIVRDGVRRILEVKGDMKVVAEAGSGQEALEKIEKVGFDVMLLDLDMPGMSGLDILVKVKAARPAAAVVFLTMHDNEEFAKRALKDGAKGFILKGSAPGELDAAVRKAVEGKLCVSQSIMEKILAQQCGAASESPLTSMSKRELQILSRMAKHMKIREIADELDISESAVSTYKARIKEKLRIEDNYELMQFARKHGLDSMNI